MGEWKETKLIDICDLVAGYAFKSKDFGEYPSKVIKIADINPPFVSSEKSSGVDLSKYNVDKLNKYIVRKGDYVLAMTGATIGKLGRYISEEHAYLNQRVLKFKPHESIDSDFLYYVLCGRAFARYVINFIDSESAQPNISAGTIGNFQFNLPDFETQQRISSILSTLDDKIENNRKICANLEAQAQALFKHWFIDFVPFKDGKFVESELGMIPVGWRVGSILDIAELYDYQRKPLSSIEREDMKGDYPYYGATSIMDYIDKYIFDGTYVLMGEDGSVVKDNGCPYLQYVWGKFWPNNHTHVMQGKNGFSTEMLYSYLSITDVRSIVTGAVQMKISQRSMSHLLTVIPSKSVCGDYNRITRPLFDLIKSTKEENARLSSLRDTLLPKLMSGAIKV